MCPLRTLLPTPTSLHRCPCHIAGVGKGLLTTRTLLTLRSWGAGRRTLRGCGPLCLRWRGLEPATRLGAGGFFPRSLGAFGRVAGQWLLFSCPVLQTTSASSRSGFSVRSRRRSRRTPLPRYTNAWWVLVAWRLPRVSSLCPLLARWLGTAQFLTLTLSSCRRTSYAWPAAGSWGYLYHGFLTRCGRTGFVLDVACR